MKSDARRTTADPKRFDIGVSYADELEIDESPTGEWVRFADVQAEIERLLRENKRLEATVQRYADAMEEDGNDRC